MTSEGEGGFGFEKPYRPPDNPEKIIYHGPHRVGQDVPEEIRRIFGTPPPKDSKRPVPPPPLPPNSYHKKPKYWQMRYTSHQQVPNRVAGVVCVAMMGVIYVLNKFSDAPERWNTRIGSRMTLQEKEDYDKKNKFYYEMMTSGPQTDSFHTDLSGENYVNVRRADSKIRWDLREVDRNIMVHRDMANPMDDPL